MPDATQACCPPASATAAECCACCSPGEGANLSRRYLTKEEKVERLQAYLRNLKAESTAVEERLAELAQG